MFSAETQYAVLYFVLTILVISALFIYGDNRSNFSQNKGSAIRLLIFMILIIGIREWASPLFGDSLAYGLYFYKAQSPDRVWYAKSKFFGYLYYYWHSLGLSPELFFVVSASVYCVPMYFISKKFAGKYSSYIFLLFFSCSFGWYSFGVNGIRNGWAFSTMIWALLAYYNRNLFATLTLLILAWCIHGSAMIPIGGMIVAYKYSNPNKALLVWISCVIISLVVGRSIQEYLATFDFIADDGGSYLTGSMEANVATFSHTGFRWDFLLFSLAPILWALYCINNNLKKGHRDIYYNFLVCSYIYANSLWVLAIRASYSNRLAQTSWWMIPLIIAYPLYKMDIFSNRCQTAVITLACYYSFTFFMYLR